MKKSTLALVVMGVVASTSVHAAEVYNKNGNKLDVYGKVKAMHYLSVLLITVVTWVRCMTSPHTPICSPSSAVTAWRRPITS